MKLDFSTLLHFIFPLSEDESRIASCSEEMFVQKLSPRESGGALALTSFKDTEVRAAIHLVKFHNNARACTLLAALCSSYFKTLPNKEYVVVPIPLSTQRFRVRGHNQSATIASSACAWVPNMSVRTDILEKTKDTPSQTTLSKEERLLNLQNAFGLRAHKATAIQGKNIILFDDVTTTGATLLEARKVLEAHAPTSISCVAIAH